MAFPQSPSLINNPKILNNYLIFTMIENNTGRRRKVRQCVLPVERGGVDGCVGDAEAEEVGLHLRDLLGLL